MIPFDENQTNESKKKSKIMLTVVLLNWIVWIMSLIPGMIRPKTSSSNKSVQLLGTKLMTEMTMIKIGMIERKK